MGNDVIPQWERRLYWIGGIGSVFYCIYSFYRECQDKMDFMEFQSGFKLLGGIKDSPDLEWNNLSLQIPYLLPLLFGHVFISKILLSLQMEIWLQRSVRLLYDFLAVMFIFGVRATFACVVESFLMYLVTFQRHTILVWIVGLLFTTTLNVEWMVDKQLELVEFIGPDSIAFFISISYVHIRLISAAVEIVKNKNSADKCSQASDSHQKHSKKSSKIFDHGQSNPCKTVSILDYLTYIFYLPIFFNGPILTFDEFLPQLTMFYRQGSHNFDLKDIAKKIVKIIIFASFVEFQSHFMFISSVQAHPGLVRTMSVPAVIGLGVWQGQYFHLKYLCLFGIGSVFSTLDGLTPPPPPACISWVYSFSDMWKYFDVGLYNFIKKYIYIPLGGSKAGFPRQIVGAVLAFAFVCYWHGAESSVLVWCIGNLIVIIMEVSASRLEYSKQGSKLKSILGASNVLRLRGLVATPFYIASSLQVMFFFFSVETGHAMVDKVVFKASWKTFLLEYAGFYLAIQNAMYARKWAVGKFNKNE